MHHDTIWRVHRACLDIVRASLLALLAAFAAVPLPFAAARAATAAAAPVLEESKVLAAIEKFKPILAKALRDSGVPGVAVGVVFDDRLIWSAGYGVRQIGGHEPVDANTVFQLASVSKPIGATLIARLVGEKRLRWDDPIVRYLPDFALADSWVTRHVTIADMYSHRSGLPDHAGDDLEEIGYSRAQIIQRLRLQKLSDFRTEYDYTNYGMTAAAEAAATAIGQPWEDASRDLLYRPAGMTSTTSRRDEYLAAANRAVPHVRHKDGRWSADFVQPTDGASPAAGVASNVADLSRWMRLQLNGGTLDGVRLVDEAALARTHVPNIVAKPLPGGYADRHSHYGFGWAVNVDTLGQVRWSHGGAFALGASTSVNLVPSQGLGFVILTNGFPIGLSESMAETFLELVFLDAPSRDWFAVYSEIFESVLYPVVDTDYTTPPPDAVPPRPLAAYTGTYEHAYFGSAEVVIGADGNLVVVMGPARRPFPLGHYSGDTFWYMPPGEFGVAPSAATFTLDELGRAWLALEGFSGKETDHGPFARRARPEKCEGRVVRSCLPR